MLAAQVVQDVDARDQAVEAFVVADYYHFAFVENRQQLGDL
jgi:hypothetical protein